MPSSVRHLVLPAAGFGTRMRVVDPGLPKELLPLGGTTVLGLAVREAELAGIQDVTVVIRQGKEVLREYLEGLDTPCSFSFVYQQEQLGECDAIACARDLVGEADFAVLYPDNVSASGPGALKTLLDCWEQVRVATQIDNRAEPLTDMVAISRTREDHLETLGNAGRINLERLDHGTWSILDFLPKGEGHFRQRYPHEWRANGLYVTGPHFFEMIDQVRREGYSGELTDGKVRRAILASGRIMRGCPLAGEMLDAGNPAGYGLLQKRLSSG